MNDFRVGEIIPGYCGGIFPLDTMGGSLTVEAVGFDWVVFRAGDRSTYLFNEDFAQLRKSIEWTDA